MAATPFDFARFIVLVTGISTLNLSAFLFIANLASRSTLFSAEYAGEAFGFMGFSFLSDTGKP